MGRQGRIKAARAAMKREGRKPEEIPAQPPSFTARREATLKLLAALDASRAEVQRARADAKDAYDIYAEVAAERDTLRAKVDAFRAQVENLEAARADLEAQKEDLLGVQEAQEQRIRDLEEERAQAQGVAR